MKIYLFLKTKVLTFTIPQRVSGSFSFDENSEEESKLINIEAKDNEWYIYSTEDVVVTAGGVGLDSTPLKPDSYYIIKRGDTNYLIYASLSFDNSFLPFIYKEDLNLVIGNDSSCNVNFSSKYVKGVAAKIYVKDGKPMLTTFKNAVYLNNVFISSEKPHIINSGDQINIFGLKIVFLNGFLLINNPMNIVRCNYASSKLTPYKIVDEESPKNVEIKDVDLYTKSDYYSKSPRIRRTIKTKEINLSPPPSQEKEQEIPAILTIGPMLATAATSGVMFYNVLGKILSGETTLAASWVTLISPTAMLLSTLLWPTLTRIFNKHVKRVRRRELLKKYNKYLNGKREELENELKIQKEILIENLIPVEQCLSIIDTAKINFWDKRNEQNDFLEVRVGKGDELLDVNVHYSEEEFSIEENDLRKKADALVEEFKYIPSVPIGYSLYENKITAIMGEEEKCYGLMHNILLQLITFYSYEDIKLVIFSSKLNENEWEYVKYLNHNLSNDKSLRFFASDLDSAKYIMDYLSIELSNRMQYEGDIRTIKPYYVIVTDDYALIKRHNFIKTLTELDDNKGFSLVILEQQMNKLPSKCNNFITLGVKESGILRNSFEAQEQVKFHDEINTSIDMMEVARKISNIPIEFEEGTNQLPDAITFLEMEKVGKVEQLNIMNRWDSNDSTSSLKTEVGVDEDGNLMYLDLHEKYHGPHGLIAGMTGSGKSEFIITYILSLAMNYSPDDVSFILIDYKGGGLAFAFENKATGVSLPHLAGTITNLDKAEMDRTLVSIDSEIKRRQTIFNEARDILGESTIDIYKYQKYFKEGRLTEPVPHLFIICDEFAELKSQQPDFMDNLISVARIGRSLGVHLILATQKPSGVVNDQIWSNTKFRVCLKVQDASDSKEMLKRPDAASLKQTGRFYLQVGYDEYFALGQSAWCGAKYFPSEKIIKQVDKSVNFIGDAGNIIKSIQAGNPNAKLEAKGEQLAAILKNIIDVAKLTNKKSRRLWLNNIDPIILVNNLEQKYEFNPIPYDIKAIIGEYDAPEKQEQGLLTYSLNKEGNTAIFGNDEIERENLINAIIYSICKSHSAKEVNIYAMDFGSEQLRMFSGFPQIGGMAFVSEEEKIKNLFKLITEEIKNRKKLLVDYGGSIENYNSKNEEKLPQILFILNDYDGILEEYPNIYEDVSSIGRDCERYGVVMLLTCNSPSSLGRKVGQCFNNKYALHFIDSSDYYSVFNMKSKSSPRDISGRGLVNNDGVHEFQTASIVEPEQNLSEFLEFVAESLRQADATVAPSIPTLPDKVTLDIIARDISTMDKVPIGISKDTLRTVKYDFTASTSTAIASNKLENINSFMDSLLDVLIRTKDLSIFFIDVLGILPSASNKVYNNKKVSYFNSNFDDVLDKLTVMQKNPENSKFKIMYVVYGLEKLKSKASVSKIEELFKTIKESENSKLILCDSSKNLKSLDFDSWYSNVKNNTDGIWIGSGFGDQQNFRISKITKEMNEKRPNNYGFYLIDSEAVLIKLLEFNDMLNQKEDEDEE